MEKGNKIQSFKVGDMIYTLQNQKYEILQRINTNKKSSQDPISTHYDHIDTFIVKRQSNKVYYILKRYELMSYQKSPQQSPSQSPSKEKNVVKEIKNKLLFHPNLLGIEELFFEKKEISQRSVKYLNLIEQYCQEGDLAYFIKHETKKSIKQGKKQTFHQKVIGKWLLQILLALEHLHFNKSTHQFLNPNNIYLTPLGNLKLNQSYFLNSIFGIKQIRKSKEPVTPLLEGYQPMLNQKKFKVNQKKDIFDFGILISYLCNSRIIRDTKKQVKSKNFSHLPPSYSQELDSIYLNCINVKKTGIQVKDILRTQYFLEVMRQFIIDKRLNIALFERIPIKKYTIHKKKTINFKPSRTSKKETDKPNDEITEGKLPKIQKKLKPTQLKQSNLRNQKHQIKQQIQVDFKKAMRASLEKLKNKLQNHQQKMSRQKKVRKNSTEKIKEDKQDSRKGLKQKPKLLIPLSSCKDSGIKSLLPPPCLPKNKNRQKTQSESNLEQNNDVRSSRQKIKSREELNDNQITRSESASPKKILDKGNSYNLTPQITFGKKTPDIEKMQTFTLKKPKQSNPGTNAYEVSSQDSRQIELERISQNLAKIFSDLKLREDDEQQLSFELDEQQEQQLRLTLKQEKQGNQSQGNLMKTYKWKFDQIVSELQQKYQPNLETIIQKTNQWDSNQFFVNKELLKRLKNQEGRYWITSEPLQTLENQMEGQF